MGELHSHKKGIDKMKTFNFLKHEEQQLMNVSAPSNDLSMKGKKSLPSSEWRDECQRPTSVLNFFYPTINYTKNSTEFPMDEVQHSHTHTFPHSLSHYSANRTKRKQMVAFCVCVGVCVCVRMCELLLCTSFWINV